MNCNNEIFRKTFEDTLDEQGYSYQYYADNIYFIAPNNIPDRITTAKLICSDPIIEKLHGSKNDNEIKTIGYFRFKFPIEGKVQDFYIFAFNNNHDKKVEFVIIPCSELKNRIALRKCITTNNQDIELRFWLLPEGNVFDTTNFGAEGEWYFIAGRMAKNTILDYSEFLNKWEL